jgi:hypothetical protein
VTKIRYPHPYPLGGVELRHPSSPIIQRE